MTKFLFGLRGRALRLAMVVCIVGPGFTIYGLQQSVLGPISTEPSFFKVFPQLDTLHTKGALKAHHATVKGAVIASYQVGALIGSLSCLLYGDILGRRRTLFLGAVLATIGQCIQASAYALGQFVAGRVILGFGIGQLSVVIPVWISETSPARHRGRDVVLAGTFLSFGYALCNWLDFGFLHLKTSSLQWRMPITVSIVLTVIMIATVFSLPESPRWLIRKNQKSTAISTLAQLRDLDEEDPSIQFEIAGIESSLADVVERHVSFWHIFRRNDQDKVFYRFCLCFFIQFFQQWCGGSLISVYASTIFQQNLGLDPNLSKVLGASLLTWKWLCCFIAFFTIDRFGRRKLFIISGIGMSICMVALTISSSFPLENKHASIASAFLLFLFNSCYPIGFLGPNFVYASEVAPVGMRVAMNAMSLGNHWLWNFVITMVSPVALNNIGYHYYIVFAVVSACIPVSVYFFFPETKNTDLETLNSLFKDAKNPWSVVGDARRLQRYNALKSDLPIDEQSSFEEKTEVLHDETKRV